MPKKKLVLLVVFVLLLLPFACPNAFAGEATEQLKVDIDHIIDILNDKSLEAEPRTQQVVELIRQRFHFPLMSQWILGLSWREATLEQKKRFIDLFTQLLENYYMGRIEAYTGTYSKNSVKYIGEQVKKKNNVWVNTLIVTENTQIPIVYKLVESKGEWRVYDVVIEEVSMVSTYRKTYSKMVKKEGFDGLFRRMEEKIESLKESKASS